MDYKNILYQHGDGIARITLNRPDKLNSFTIDMHRELRDALTRLKADATTRVLLLTGAGRGFCAGQDLADIAGPNASKELAEAGDPLGHVIGNWYNPLVKTLRALPFPVVCAVNGVAAGAGANIALACDIVLAARSATFIEVFCKIGLMPDTGGTYFLPRTVGSARAMGLALLGDKLSAEEAERWGLIWKCVDDAALSAEAEALAHRFATAPTRALAAAKQALNASGRNTLDAQLALECDAMRELGCSADYKEGVAAFLEKRAPRFEGK
jgi:2-(1,2-epoxy-1,2-dihydrophenyl)acetyl-CoA isomerase